MKHQIARITKRSELLVLKKTSTKFPHWLTKQVTPSDFRKKYEDMYERMNKAKKEKTSFLTSNHPVRRSSWPWYETKNFKRDVPPLIISSLLKHYAVMHYHESLLATSDAGALLRIKLNDELALLGKMSSQLRLDEAQ